MKPPCPYLRIGAGLCETERYACVLTYDVSTTIPVRGKNLLFFTGDKLLGKLSDDGTLTIFYDYACDGYSPTVRAFGRWNRITPTPHKAGFFPAILHDFTRQFCEVKLCPWNRDDSDTWFYNSLVAGGEDKNIAGTYFGAVSRLLGDIWYRFRKSDQSLSIAPFSIQHATICNCPKCKP